MMSNKNPAILAAFFINAAKEKAEQKKNQKKIDYISSVSSYACSTIHDNAIRLAHNRLDEIEQVLNSLFETLESEIDDMEIKDLALLLNKILNSINSWGLSEEEYSAIIKTIQGIRFNF